MSATDLAGQRDVIGKQDEWQVWVETTGRVTIYVNPGWTTVTSSNDAAGKLVAGVPRLLGIRKNNTTGKISVWLDGVQGWRGEQVRRGF